MDSESVEQLQGYYEARAPEYEAIYDFENHERRKELDAIETLVKSSFGGKKVLEIACGTGYWTEILSDVSENILAVDFSDAMLQISRARKYAHQNNQHNQHKQIEHKQFDAYNLGALVGQFNAALAGFWLSHVPKNRMELFLSGLQSRLQTGATVLFLDNNLVEGMGGSLIEKNNSADTFKERTLNDGSKHAIIKNYFTKEELTELLTPFGSEVHITMGKWYWSAVYQSKQLFKK